jgi:signal transduction histidine kinase
MSSGSALPVSLGRLLDAFVAVGSDLDLPATLRRIVETATELVDARYGALGVLNVDRTELTDFITVGIDDEMYCRIGDPPKGHGILGLLIADPRPLRLADLQTHPDRFGFPPNHPEMRSFLGVPVMVRDAVFGNLYLTEKRSAAAFTETDEELTVALAAAAGVAIENARLHARVRDVALLEDRERIAMELHDLVIQQLFATGMSLQATSRIATEADVSRRIEMAVDDLDTTIRQIRSSIFALSTENRAPGPGVRSRVLDLVAEVAPTLASEPGLSFSGPVDTEISSELGDEVVIVLREALSNVARHARASHVDVEIGVDDGDLVVRICDDGIGYSPDGSGRGGRGLVNLLTRAERRGGTFVVEAGAAGGTVAVWRVPLMP